MSNPTLTSLFHKLIPIANLNNLIDFWLKEDIPSFDYAGLIVGNKIQKATLWCKSEGVIAGIPFVDQIFSRLNCKVEWSITEGTFVKFSNDISNDLSNDNSNDISNDKNDKNVGNVTRQSVAVISGEVSSLLIGERIALNLLSRCSGIATLSHRANQLKKSNPNFRGVIAGTRKTTPGFRLVEKYGMLIGGVDQHRMDLSAMIM